ncbi:MAG: hypothetical protein JKX97_05835, partial [Candidatus Lindowbacteria bacterium]|nr:hypothetical protein [Candidatus Lindowbacteria bacterium]
MNTRNRSAAWAFAIIACLVLTITAAQTATFSNINISANWNVVTAYGNGTGYGDIRFQPGSPYVKRASGNDTVIFQSGAIDRSGSGALINVNEVMDSVVVLSTGVFYAAANADSLTAILADTDPTDRIVGSITDTSASALFYAVRLAAGGTDDLFVGMKQAGGLSTTSMMGRPGMDTFIGVFMNENPNGTGFVQGLYLFFRPAETFVAAAHINQGQTFPADTMTAGLLRPTSAPGRAEFLPDSTLTLQQA